MDQEGLQLDKLAAEGVQSLKESSETPNDGKIEEKKCRFFPEVDSSVRTRSGPHVRYKIVGQSKVVIPGYLYAL